MQVQPRYDTYAASDFFRNGTSARPLPVGTIARGELRSDTLLYTGMVNGQPSTQFPFPITRQVLARGQERFNIYCSPCHSKVGDGNGMVVQRGFTHPPSYHIQRLRDAPVGHFFDVMSNGFGAMYSYASRVAPADRWAIAAYIRVLQAARPGPPDPEDRGVTTVLQTPAGGANPTTRAAPAPPSLRGKPR
jgi:mono/diheme cytochrome c family protein